MRGISVVLTTVLLVMIAASLVLSYFFWAQGEANFLFSKGSEDVSRALASPPSIAHAFGVYDANTGVTDLTVVFRVEQPFDENVTLAIYSLDDVVVYSGIWHVSCGADPCTQHAYLDLSPGIYTLQVSTSAGTSRYAKYFRVTEYVPPMADVYVASLSAQSPADTGTVIEVDASICSQSASSSADVNVIFRLDGTYLGSNLATIPRNGCTAVSMNYTVQYGTHSIDINVVPLSVTDSDPTNNTGSTAVQGVAPDLYFSSINAYQNHYSGTTALLFGDWNTFTLELNVCNGGDGNTLSSFAVDLSSTNASIPSSVSVPSLSPGQCTLVTVDGNTIPSGSVSITADIDYSGYQTNTTNDSISGTFPTAYYDECNSCSSCSAAFVDANAMSNQYDVNGYILLISDVESVGDSYGCVCADGTKPPKNKWITFDGAGHEITEINGVAVLLDNSATRIRVVGLEINYVNLEAQPAGPTGGIAMWPAYDVIVEDVNIVGSGQDFEGVYLQGSNITIRRVHISAFANSNTTAAEGIALDAGGPYQFYNVYLEISGNLCDAMYVSSFDSNLVISGSTIVSSCNPGEGIYMYDSNSSNIFLEGSSIQSKNHAVVYRADSSAQMSASVFVDLSMRDSTVDGNLADWAVYSETVSVNCSGCDTGHRFYTDLMNIDGDGNLIDNCSCDVSP